SSRSRATSIRRTWAGSSWCWSRRGGRSALPRLPPPVLLRELSPLAGIEAAVRLVVLTHALLLVRRQRLETTIALLEHPLLLAVQLLPARVVVPGGALLMGCQLLPRPAVPLLARSRHGEREETEQRQHEPPHPFDCSSPLGVSSSSVVVWMASKCSTFSKFLSSGRFTNTSGAAATAGGGPPPHPLS